VGHGVLDLIPPGTLRLDVGKTGYGAAVAQSEIDATLIRLARAGSTVVRLKGGDPFVFGRGGEEALALRHAGIPFHVVPGVTSGTAAPALAGIPVTHRGMARSVAFITAITAPEATTSTDPPHDWQALARLDTLVVYMAGRAAPSVARSLLDAGRHPRTPAALITDSSLPSEELHITDLAAMAAAGEAAPGGRASLLVVGTVVGLHDQLDPDPRPEPLAGPPVGGAR
jgi:uroporphyrin-III C-methyltransferase